MGGKGGQKKTVASARNQLAQNRFERAFGAGAPCPLDVGRIREQQRYAFLAQRGESFGVEFLSVNRSVIDFEIAAVNHDAGRGANRQRDRVRGRMRYPQGLDIKRPDHKALARGDRVQIFFGAAQASFFETAAHEREGQCGTIDRHRKFAQ